MNKTFCKLTLAVLITSVTSVSAAVFNVQKYGAIPNDGKPDTAAVIAAIKAAQSAGGGTVFFPKGTYELRHINTLDPKNTDEKAGLALTNIHFKGQDRDSSIIKSIESPGRYLITFRGSQKLTISDLTFDANGSRHYGGVRFYECKKVKINHNRYFDSNVPARDNPPRKDETDIYPFVFAKGATLSEDVTITDNLIEDLQLEVDAIRRARIANNTVLRPVMTAGIGFFSLQYQDQKPPDICAEDVIVENNTIHAAGNVITGIALHLDPPMHTDGSPVTGVVFRNITIKNNTIVALEKGSRLSDAIKIGQTDFSQPTKNITYDNIKVIGNKIIVKPQADFLDSLIFVITSRPQDGGDFKFDNLTIKDNIFYYNGKQKLIDVRFPGKNFIEKNNQRKPAPSKL